MPLLIVVDFDRRLFVYGYSEPIEPKSDYIPKGWTGIVDDPLDHVPEEIRSLWGYHWSAKRSVSRVNQMIEEWEQLRCLGARVRDPVSFPEALTIARSTMERVRHNVALLAERLPRAGYEFEDPANAHVPPPPDVGRLIAEIEEAIGPMSLSFRVFHEVVGAVNFCQSQQQLVQWRDERRSRASEIELLGEEDPLYVLPLADLHRDLMSQRSDRRRPGQYARYGWREGGEDRWYCFFAPDEFHKANYSGGENYNLFLPDPAADFRIRDLYTGTSDDEEEDREWFVDYLRNVFRGGGFRGKWDEGRGKHPPESRLIHELRRGLLEV